MTSTDFQKAIVRINRGGKPEGAGVLVTPTHVITCAHVVNTVTGRKVDSQERPEEKLELHFPFLNASVQAEVEEEGWYPIAMDGSGDVAVLCLLGETPAGAVPVPLRVPPAFWELPFRAFGYPKHVDEGAWAHGILTAPVGNGNVQMEAVKSEGYAVQTGYSGTPVWSDEAQGVLGIVVTADRNERIRVGHMIPTESLMRVWPALTPETTPPIPLPRVTPTAGGAVMPESEYYIHREADERGKVLLEQPVGVTVAIYGAFQIGKSSLLAQLIRRAEEQGKAIIYLDFQEFLGEDDTAATFYPKFFAAFNTFANQGA